MKVDLFFTEKLKKYGLVKWSLFFSQKLHLKILLVSTFFSRFFNVEANTIVYNSKKKNIQITILIFTIKK